MTLRHRGTARPGWALGVATCVWLSAGAASAGQIVGFAWYSGVASVAAEPVVAPPSPNNDNQVGTSPNVINVWQKDYVAIGTVDIVFDVTATGGTTEYVMLEGVSNGTGVDWSGYHVELGFGTGAGFVKSTAGDGVDCDSPDFDSEISFDPLPGFFPSYTAGEDDLIAGGGIMPNGAYAGNFVFHIDVPDGITQFTVRQSPIGIVPEPSTALLVGAGLLGLGRRGRRRGRER